VTKTTPAAVLEAQRHLLVRRRELFGRLAALRALRVPVPDYRGFSLLTAWRSLTFARQASIFFGTVRRALRRRWLHRRPLGLTRESLV
jgi:hypothetical protein